MKEWVVAEGRNTVWTPEMAWFIWACWSSDSKSETTRRPLTMKLTSMSRARSTTRLEKLVIDTFGRWATASRIIAWRSARSNRPAPFWGLLIAATITSSNRRDATSISSRCPLWIGSKDPG